MISAKKREAKRTRRDGGLTKSATQTTGKDTHRERKQVKVAAAKGRPMLTWVGKHPFGRVNAFPAQLVEKFDPRVELHEPEKDGLLFHGDNKEVLAYLLANGYRGKVNLVYIDPPFDSGA